MRNLKYLLIWLASIVFVSAGNAQETGWSEPVSIDNINTGGNKTAPFITSDGLKMYYTAVGPNGYADIFITEWNGQEWQAGENIGNPPNTNLIERHPSVTSDGQTLYFARYGGEGSYGVYDIWKSEWNEDSGSWEQIENLGEIINSAFHEWSPFISRDGTKLYFASDECTPRRCGYGDKDIYVAEWDSISEQWDNVTNLGPEVNSLSGDDFPSVTANGQKLYFSSWSWYGDSCNLGPREIYIALWNGEQFSDVHTVCAPVSGPDFDCFPSISPDGNKLYFASVRDNHPNFYHIYYSERNDTYIDYEKEEQHDFSLKVLVSPNPFNENVKIMYYLPFSGAASLNIYNQLGQNILVMENQLMLDGWHEYNWNGKGLDGFKVTSGVYFAVLEQGKNKIAKKMILLK